MNFRKVSDEQVRQVWEGLDARPVEVFQSQTYLACVYPERTFLRITINRTSVQPNGHWEDGITWDDIQEIKSAIGYGNWWAIEIYPPDEEVVNVANMRHIWLCPTPPAQAWRKS